MNREIVRLKQEAKELARGLAASPFYERCATQMQSSRDAFFDHPMVLRLQEDVLPFLYDDYGHGIEHSKKVAIEAGAIVLAELALRHGESDEPGGAADSASAGSIAGEEPGRARRLALLAMLAGLLHDVARLEERHALKGAEMARIILQEYPLSDRDRELVAQAIARHEAFSAPDRETGKDSGGEQPPGEHPTGDAEADLLAGALYDADKFRWGHDNFVTTLWEICDYEEWPLSEIVARFPGGMERVRSVASTFRTRVGRLYGPDIIAQGLQLGNELLARLEAAVGADAPLNGARE